MILAAIATAVGAVGVGLLVLIVGDYLDDTRAREPQLTLDGESVEAIPEETIGVFDGSDSETADTGGTQ